MYINQKEKITYVTKMQVFKHTDAHTRNDVMCNKAYVHRSDLGDAKWHRGGANMSTG